MSEDQEVLKPDKPVELQREFSDKLGGAPHSKRSLRLWLKLLIETCINALQLSLSPLVQDNG